MTGLCRPLVRRRAAGRLGEAAARLQRARDAGRLPRDRGGHRGRRRAALEDRATVSGRRRVGAGLLGSVALLGAAAGCVLRPVGAAARPRRCGPSTTPSPPRSVAVTVDQQRGGLAGGGSVIRRLVADDGGA